MNSHQPIFDRFNVEDEEIRCLIKTSVSKDFGGGSVVNIRETLFRRIIVDWRNPGRP
jgi:hypothetical protein